MPLENLNDYTLDGDSLGVSKVTVDSSTKVSWQDLSSRTYKAYLYIDKGVDHFNEDYTHRFEMFKDNVLASCLEAHYMLANAVGDFRELEVAAESAVAFVTYDDEPDIILYLLESGVKQDDRWWYEDDPNPQNGVNYFVTVTRDRDGGDNSEGRYDAFICVNDYYGEPGSELKKQLTLSVSEGEQEDWRYAYALSTYDTDANPVANVDGYTQNLYLEMPEIYQIMTCSLDEQAILSGDIAIQE